MTDEVQNDPVVETVAEAPVVEAAEPAVAEEVAVKPDFADHSVYSAFAAYVEEAGGAATTRLQQLLEEARELFNAHGV